MTTSPRETARGRRGRVGAALRRVLPFVVSGVLLAYLFERIDVRVALDHLTLGRTLRFLPPLALFSVATLVIEAQCLHRVVAANAHVAAPLDRITAARIKAACYLLGVLNYALGAGGLSVLLRRRTGTTIAAAVGMVFVISLFDVGSVLAWTGVGGALLPESAELIRFGVIGGLIAAIVAGFAFLRAPVPLGPLERVRALPILAPARTAPFSLLVEIGLLRLVFVGCYVGLVGALVGGFDVSVSPVELAFNVGVMLVVSALPVAAGGLGTGQVVFVELFSGAAADPVLLAMSVLFSMAMIVSRALIGLLFASEFAREAYHAARRERHEGERDPNA